MQYPSESMDAILYLWNRECHKEWTESKEEPIFFENFYENEFMKKTIEMLITLDISSEQFIESLMNTDFIKNINQFYFKKHPKEKKNLYVANSEMANKEGQFLFFVYVYFKYSHLDPNNFKKESVISLWTQLVRLMKIFANSKNPNTVLWSLELIFMFSKKYSPKEALNEGFKTDLHHALNEKLSFISNLASG